MTRRRTRGVTGHIAPRALAVLTALLTLSGLVLAGPAAVAHVTVDPPTAPAGSYSTLTFRVPTESDSASTTKVALYLPPAPALASVSVRPHPGWRSTMHRDGDAVRRIVWRATSPQSYIRPGEFDEFSIAVGPVPRSGRVVFKALQTYSDGSVVRWIDPAVAGQPEPEHPAPVLAITPAGHRATHEHTSRAPLVLSIVAVALAAVSLALSIARRRRS